MLEQIVKADKGGLFNEILIESLCPVPLEVIKNYLAILKNAYFFNVGLQRQSASIAEMIPSILSCWESIKLKTSENGRISCDYLIEDFKKKILLNIQASTEIQLESINKLLYFKILL
jgi:hypothetical protein